MANITVQRNGGSAAPAPLAREWDPFRMMQELMRWDPISELAPRWISEVPSLNPAFDVKETEKAFVFKADLPGIKNSDIEVKMTGNRLTVSGKREAERTEKGETYYSYERSYGSFSRAFTLPDGVDADKIEADLKDGVLSITLPKKPEVLPKQVEVKAK